MRRTNTEVERHVRTAEVGLWRSPAIGFATPYGLVPFVKSSEDLEVLLRHPGLLVGGQVVEMSGFSLHRSLRHAMRLQSEPGLSSSSTPFETLASNQHVQVSYPADLLWLAHKDSLKKFEGFIADSLPLSEMAITAAESKKIATRLTSIAAVSRRKYSFWRQATREKYGSAGTLSRLLIEASIAAANGARAHSMGGIVPCLDLRTPGSLTLVDSYNAAYGHLVDDRLSNGLRTPAYLYTIAMNSTLIRPSKWPPLLDRLLQRTDNALATELYEGVHLAIRGLDRISLDPGRVSVGTQLIQKLVTVCNSHQYPLSWSRAGFAGLAARDWGVQFASFRSNLQVGDVYPQVGGISDPVYRFGRVVNPVQKVLWTRHEVELAMGGPDGGLPDLGIANTSPTPVQLQHDAEYRIRFSKPYNTASFRYLDSLWRSHIEENETQPGREYLQSFQAPYNHWGLR